METLKRLDHHIAKVNDHKSEKKAQSIVYVKIFKEMVMADREELKYIQKKSDTTKVQKNGS